MQVDFIRSEKKWNDFLLENNGTFLQSIQWGNFKKNYQKVFRIEAREGDEIRGLCQFFEEKSPFGDYFYIPHGPVVKNKEAEKEILQKVVEIGKNRKSVFIKIEPLKVMEVGERAFFRIQPRKTLISRIDKSSQKILGEFKKNTRYNVRYAENKGVVIEKGSLEDIDYFFNLLCKTRGRQKFTSYSKEYYQKLLVTNNCDLVLAKHGGEVVAAIIVLYFGTTIYFLHSASDHSKRKLKGPVLARFKAIEFAKEKGCKTYDFGGLSEENFPGVTSFKKGFGGKEFIYPEARDVPLRKIYYETYKLTKSIRNKLRLILR